MTLATQIVSAAYAGDGSSVAFAVPFPFFSAAGLLVTLYDGSTDLTVPTTLNATGTGGYSVTSTADPDTGESPNGTVTFDVAPTATQRVVIWRGTVPRQLLALPDGGPFPGPSIEAALDRTAMVMAQLVASAAYMVRAPLYDLAPTMELPSKKARTGNGAGSLLGFDANGNVAVKPIGTNTAAFAIAASGNGTITVSAAGTLDLTAPNVTIGGPNVLIEGTTVEIGSTGDLLQLVSNGTLLMASAGPMTLAGVGASTFGSSAGAVTLLAGGGDLTMGSSTGNVNINAPAGDFIFTGGPVSMASIGNVFFSATGTAGSVSLFLEAAGTIAAVADTIDLFPAHGGAPVYVNSGTANLTLHSGSRVALDSGGGITATAVGTVFLQGGVMEIGSTSGLLQLVSAGTLLMTSGGPMTLAGVGTSTFGSSAGAVTLLAGGGNLSMGSSAGSVSINAVAGITATAAGAVIIEGATVEIGSTAGLLQLVSVGTLLMSSGGPMTLAGVGTSTFGSSAGAVTLLAGGGDLSMGSSTGNVTIDVAAGPIFQTGTGAPGALPNSCIYLRQDGTTGTRWYVGTGSGSNPVAGV